MKRIYQIELNKRITKPVAIVSFLLGFMLAKLLHWSFPYTNPYYLGTYLLLRVMDYFTTTNVTNLVSLLREKGYHQVDDIKEANPLFSKPPSGKELLSLRSLLAQVMGIALAIIHPGFGIAIMLFTTKAQIGNTQLGYDLRATLKNS